MKKVKIVSMVLALVCALGMFGLVACSGGSSSSASSSAAQSDEELIKADIDSTIETYLNAETVAAEMEKDSSYASYVAMGLDMEEFAGAIIDMMQFDVAGVEVDESGETAVATLAITLPDFESDEAQAVMSEQFEAALADVDLENASEDELMKLVMDTMIDVMKTADLPKTTVEANIDYEKVNGTWTATNADELEEAIANAGSSSTESTVDEAAEDVSEAEAASSSASESASN